MKTYTTTRSILFGNSARMLALTILITFLMSFTSYAGEHGFKLIEKRFVKELNAECYFFEHEKSGARLIKIKTDDPNKTFSIAFKTFPESDNGAPHIMEHAVLNGSKAFPVKSPFDILLKGSLNTFLNAFTSKDFTMYPVASMNDKDYFNLMHVYLDAVFNPLIYTDGRILKQEGWHYELTDKDSAVEYKGVVYNEMKGAYSDPSREVYYQVYKNLFPDNAYGLESGGYPSAIPTLTNDEFLKFHQKYYHPENSYIFLYGDGDLDRELAFIDKEYLSKYARTGNRADVNDQKPFTAMKEVHAFYPVTDGAPTDAQTFLNYSFVAGHNTDQALCMALDILSEVLFNQESAPVRLALQEAGIGQDVSASASNYKQNVFSIDVQNANPADKDKFYTTLMETLKSVADKGIDKQTVEGVINRMEFRLREGNDAQKGMTYIMQSQPGFFFAGDPFLGLEYEKPLAEVKTALTTNYLEDIIRKYFLNNNLSVLVVVEPKTGIDQERAAKTQAELKAYKATLSPDAIAALVEDTRALIEYQKREDTPEAIATIPMLTLQDINPKSAWYPVATSTLAGVPVLHHEEFTNNVVYVNLFFDLRVLPQELIPYAALLANLYGTLNTENYSYGDLNKALNINTGGFYTSLRSFTEDMDDSKLIPKFTVTSKAMNNKLDKLFGLGSEMLVKTKFTDTERLKTVLARHQSQVESNMKGNGYMVASKRLSSYISKQGLFNELTSGLQYYWFVTELSKDFGNNSAELIEKLQKTAALLITKANMTAAVTCGKNDVEAFTKGLASFEKNLPSGQGAYAAWDLTPVKKNEGILAASKVQYVIDGYNFKKLGYAWSGKMRVLSQILSTDWLQTQIRVIGGAYGGFSQFGLTGNATFNSYRDPNLKETIDNYNATPDYLSKFEADSTAMLRYIIGTISGMDSPLTPSQKGDQAYMHYFNKRTKEDVQRDRDAVLSTRVDDIRGFSKLVKDVLNQGDVCVYGNEEKIKANEQLFMNLVKIEK
jgi:presequence protease